MLDEQIELLELVHDPICPPRAGVAGEGIYLELWREYLKTDPGRLDRILHNTLYSQPNQRQAHVCASFMTFMGCNAGVGFTVDAERIAKTHKARQHAFIMAWSVENRRYSGVNSGIRAIESMLARPGLYSQVSGRTGINWSTLEDITADDYDTVEAMVEWWSGDDASEIRRIAAPMIEAENMRARSRLFKS